MSSALPLGIAIFPDVVVLNYLRKRANQSIRMNKDCLLTCIARDYRETGVKPRHGKSRYKYVGLYLSFVGLFMSFYMRLQVYLHFATLIYCCEIKIKMHTTWKLLCFVKRDLMFHPLWFFFHNWVFIVIDWTCFVVCLPREGKKTRSILTDISHAIFTGPKIA